MFVLQTRSRALFEDRMSERLRPVKIDTGPDQASQIEVVQLALVDTTVTTMALSHPVHFHLRGTPKNRPGHWLLQFMLSGSSANNFVNLPRPVQLTGDLGLLLPNDYPLDIYGPAQAKYFIMELRPEDLQDVANRMGEEYTVPEPTTCFALDYGSGAGLRRYGELLAYEMSHRSSFLSGDHIRSACEQYLLSLLVLTVSASRKKTASGLVSASSAKPYYVKRAVDYIHATLPDPIGILDLVAAAGVSQRTLYRGFKVYYGQSPMDYVRCVRLDRVREELTATDPTIASVTDIALKWHFTHLSNFAMTYSRRFGERPSQTLARL